MAEPITTRVRGDGVDLQLYEWPGEGRPIFLAHATGFHARCWDQVVAHLPGRHVFAIDMRGHGRSEKHEPPYPWMAFARDCAAVAKALGLRDAIAVGHSKGGFAVTMAAHLEPGVFGALVLIDPVILPPEAYTEMMRPRGEHFSARRRNQWTSPAEMFERFHARPPFSTWDPQCLRDYCDHGLLPDPSGDAYVLACPPAIEAATYAGSAGSEGIYEAIAAITVPVRVLRATPRTPDGTMNMDSSPTAPDLARRFANGHDVPLYHLSHFIPMQDPALVARHILEVASELPANILA